MDGQTGLWRRLWIFGVLSEMLFLSGCINRATNWAEKVAFQDVQMPTQCSGWEKLEMKNRTRYALARENQRLLVNIDAHNLRGRNLGCWK